MSSPICVVHLVWAPLGLDPVRSFLASYREHPAGVAHRLAILANGFDGPEDPRLRAVHRELGPVPHELLLAPAPMLDLAAYRWAAPQLEADRLCFLNSYSRVLADGWLSLLDGAMRPERVGMVGASASYESPYTAAPPWLKPLRRGSFAPFPNPHLRSNGFMLPRRLMLELEWPAPRRKAAAWALESGRRSISNQVWERGLEVLVVGRDGVSFPRARWPASATFRAGGQRNLLIADNRTEQYETAAPAFQARLREMAWGSP